MATESIADTLIENMQLQLNRLVSQLKDLEECKTELTDEEYEEMKTETNEQIEEFTDILDHMNNKDIPLLNMDALDTMRTTIQNAVNVAFNTNGNDVKKAVVAQNLNALKTQVEQSEQAFKLKKITLAEWEKEKTGLLKELYDKGEILSAEDLTFLKTKIDELYNHIEKVNDD